MKQEQQVRKAFALIEVVAVLVLLGLVCSVGVVAGAQSRTSAGLAGSLANLKKIGETTGAYAADFDDQAWSFSWGEGENETQYDDLGVPVDATTAVMYQSVDIVRRLSGNDNIPRYGDRFGALYLGPLVLADYLHDSLPAEWMVSPGDRIRLDWAADPDYPPDDIDGSEHYGDTFGPYGSSYVHMPAFISQDQKIDQHRAIYQYRPTHSLMWLPGDVSFGGRRMAEVSFPAQKVLMAERESFYFGHRPAYYLHPSARVPVLMVDGAASPRSTADANASWQPNQPQDSNRKSLLDYRPHLQYESPPMTEGSDTDDDIESAYKWTRGGLSGIDFAGEREE